MNNETNSNNGNNSDTRKIGDNPTTEKTTTEEFKLDGDELLAKVRELLHEGNVRRIILKNSDGNVMVEIPLTVGVVGALLLPMWAAIGAIAALAANLTIVVERKEV
jgi:hypothetical protein